MPEASIWMIFRHRFDHDDRFSSELDAERGWFATPEAAEAEAERLNAPILARYQAHVAEVATRNRQQEAAHRKAVKEAEALRAAGLRKSLPRKPDPIEPLNLLAWRRRSGESWYGIDEIEEAG